MMSLGAPCRQLAEYIALVTLKALHIREGKDLDPFTKIAGHRYYNNY